MPAARRRSGATADTDTTLVPREHRGLISPGAEKELDALDEAEELMAPTIHAQDRLAGKRGKRGKADKVDLVIDTWLAVMVLIGICGLALWQRFCSRGGTRVWAHISSGCGR